MGWQAFGTVQAHAWESRQEGGQAAVDGEPLDFDAPVALVIERDFHGNSAVAEMGPDEARRVAADLLAAARRAEERGA